VEVSASQQPEHRQSLLWSMNLSLMIGVLMLVMKVSAYRLTGSAASHLEPLEEHDTVHRDAAGHCLIPPV
jgi:hypothetical protein